LEEEAKRDEKIKKSTGNNKKETYLTPETGSGGQKTYLKK